VTTPVGDVSSRLPGPPRGPGTKKKATGVSPARNIVGVVVLVAVLVAGGLEVVARRQAMAASAKLETALAREEGDLLTQKEVEELIGKTADGPPTDDGAEQQVTYTWRGIIRRYPIHAYFTRGSRPGLLRYSLGD